MEVSDDDPLKDLKPDALHVLLLVGLLAIALIINNMLHKWHVPVPEAISTIAIGTFCGGVAMALTSVDRNAYRTLEDESALQFLLFFIAPIIFAEGYGLKSRQFFENITRILLHAFLGTLISTVSVAVILYYAPRWTDLSASLHLSLAEALTFGSLISATDPVTTLAIFKDQCMVENGLGYLYYSVLGESILNDAVAITLFDSFGALVKKEEEITLSTVDDILITFVVTFLASMCIGVASGCVAALVLKVARLGAGSTEEEHFYFNVPEIGVTLVLAYVPFLICTAAGLSGIVAVMFAGITMRHYAHYNLTQVTRLAFLPIVELMASLSETYIFLLLGLGIFLMGKDAYSLPFILWTALGCLVGRAANVYPIAVVANRCTKGHPMSVREQHMIWFAGLRGAVAFMCALGFPRNAESNKRPIVLACTTVLVCVSILLLGWPTASMLRCLGITGSEAARQPALDAQEAAAAPPSSSFSKCGDLIEACLERLLMTEDGRAERKEACQAAVGHTFSKAVTHPRLSSFGLNEGPLPEGVLAAGASDAAGRLSLGNGRLSLGAGHHAALRVPLSGAQARHSSPPGRSSDAAAAAAAAEANATTMAERLSVPPPLPRLSAMRLSAGRASMTGREPRRSSRMLCDP
eukprot:TRINITY_DN8953_c0_g1_i1.p1 TRINITY_DN8953_c0_g1~~TRINITY_DN8953_c0_g1_i1.p1  ORF type:complete len:638 (+),score=100.14 TRINITY_DN8953_c0_g1_i1:61-1974(+)